MGVNVEQTTCGCIVNGVRAARDTRADLVARGPDTHLHVCEAVCRHDLLDAAHDDHLDDLCGN